MWGMRDQMSGGGDRTGAGIRRRVVPCTIQHGGMGRNADKIFGIDEVISSANTSNLNI
jgi:hypothetical protein